MPIQVSRPNPEKFGRPDQFQDLDLSTTLLVERVGARSNICPDISGASAIIIVHRHETDPDGLIAREAERLGIKVEYAFRLNALL